MAFYSWGRDPSLPVQSRWPLAMTTGRLPAHHLSVTAALPGRQQQNWNQFRLSGWHSIPSSGNGDSLCHIPSHHWNSGHFRIGRDTPQEGRGFLVRNQRY